MNTATLGGKPIYGTPARDHINWFECHTGASRAGCGMFLMTTQDYTTVTNDAGGGTTDLVLNDGSQRGAMTLKVFVAGAVPFVTSLDNANPQDSNQIKDGMLRVIVFDARRLYTTPTTKAYNCISQPFTWSSSDYLYYSHSLNSGTPWTWGGAITDLGIPNLPSNPSWKPRNLIFDGTPISRIVDDIAARLWLVVGFDPTNASAGSGISFCNPGARSSGNNTTFNDAIKTRLAGDPAQRSSFAVPGIFTVTFKGSDGGNDPFANRVYTKEITVGSGTQKQPLNVGDIIAIRSGSSWANQTDMDSIAADLAARAYSFLNASRAEYEFSGIWPFTCDGSIRGIRWMMSDDGAKTQIRIDNEEDWDCLGDIRRIIEFSSNHGTIGLGSANASTNSGGGSKFFWAPGTPVVLLTVIDTAWSDSTVLGQGVYRARIDTADVSSFDPTGTATDGTIFTQGTTDVLVRNEAELGLTERLIDPAGTQITFAGVLLGTIATAGKFQGVAVYHIVGFQPAFCGGT